MGAMKIVAEGNLGRDPEEKQTKTGKTMATFRMACTERVKEGDQWIDGDTTWLSVLTFDYLADRVTSNLSKGQTVRVEGRFRLREWEGQDGALRTDPEIIADSVTLVLRAEKKQQDAPRQQPKPKRQYNDEDIPF